jgi:peptidoglycan/xylan/chitin deacetylase (PgdA/CDA1 family)
VHARKSAGGTPYAWRRVYRGPLILCYHALSSRWHSSLALSTDVLASHLSRLRRRGFTGLTFRDAGRHRADGTLPARSVVVTFDDGYSSTLEALPVLDQLGFPATVFVVTRFVDSGLPLRWGGIEQWAENANELAPLGWTDLEKLVAAGWEVGSHTVTHPRLIDVDDRALEEELATSKALIEARLGRCDTIAYPYGLADERVAAVAARVGYAQGCTLSSFTVDEPLRRPRIGMYPSDARWLTSVKLRRHATTVRSTRIGATIARLSEV